MPTPTPDPDATARVDSDLTYTPSPRSGPQAQFAPGTMIAGRYRIAGILGSGGMGEVYRADDTKLDQVVALKFLPRRLERDPILRDRLHDEVRLGRQVSHPNVCRIYDIVDWEGAHFVAMEYVDGEDLSRLLRRIGRLAHDKAVDIARGIAAGLMAAHAKGILHRDLKPANVMIDSRGDSRIMDFGLALAAGDDDGTISGTPAYMAPEQIEGQPATVQSDLYALGLVMYELFTGKRAHNAQTMPERVRELTSEITTPSSVIRDLDPAVERIILRCLSSDPAQRPRSAREVIESLPGGDPLAAALAAGETPSPRIVAAAGTEGSLSRTAAWSLLGVIAVLFATFIYVLDQVNVTRFMNAPRSPEVLHDRAEELLRTFGVETEGTPVSELSRKTAYLLWRDSAKGLQKGPAPFTCRLMYGVGPDDFTDDMIAGAGRTTVEIDAHGRLTFLLSAPPGVWKERTLDPSIVLRAAGLDPASLKPAQSRFAPPAPFDRFTAWSGTYPGDTTPVRAELATWHGTPTFFRVTGAWDDAAPRELAFENREVVIYVHILAILLIAGGLVMARRNLRLRRGDRQGAWRLAMAVFLIQLVSGFLVRGLSSDLLESADIAKRTVSGALLGAAIAYLFYIAIEPLVRRRWPAQLISWSRLLAGRWRDPMVGRDVLVGLIGAFAHSLIGIGGGLVIARATGSEPPVNVESIYLISGLRTILSQLFEGVTGGVAQAFGVMALLALLTALVRKRAIAVAGLFVIYLTGFLFATGGELQFLLLVVPLAVVLVFIAVRYGLLAYAVTMMVFFWVFFLPYMPVRWAMPMLLVPLGATALLAVWAFYTSLGGQSLVSASMLDE
jgi:Protein kinase domain